MEQKLYGLTQSGNRFFYSIGNQEAYAIQIKPFPAAWKKTASTPWKRTHTGFLHLDNLGLSQGPSGLELDPIAEFERTDVNVYRLAPSTGKFEFEPEWGDSMSFKDWEEGFNWRATVSNLMNDIDPRVLDELRQFSHFHLNLLEALYNWPGFEDLMDSNPALAACVAGRIRVGAQKGKRRPMLDYRKLVQASEREIAAAIGFGDSEDVVTILKKLVPDACKPLELINFPELLENPVIRKALLNTGSITHPALLLLRSPLLREKLTGAFLSELESIFRNRSANPTYAAS